MIDIYFMNTGNDTIQASLLCCSAKNCMVDVRLIQISDMKSKFAEHADKIIRFDYPSENLMYFRTKCFSEVILERPSWFLDTDMLVIQPLPQLKNIGFCSRVFGKNDIINTNFKNMNLDEYKNRTLGDIWPILGCTTFLLERNIWKEVLFLYNKLPNKFLSWYGDQEALREFTTKNSNYIKLQENEYACLPEYYLEFSELAKIIHFKGPKRKTLMLDTASQFGLTT